MVKQERALRTREALIESAATVFDRDGFSVASLAAISSLAGVSNGALHFHFSSKAGVADAVEQAASERLELLVGVHGEAVGNALQMLVDTSHRLARELGEDVVLRAGFELSRDQVRQGGRDLYRQWHAWVEEALKRAEGEGALNGIAPEQVASSVVAATTGFEVLGARDPEWLSRRTVTRFWQLLLPQLATPPVLGSLVAAGGPSGDHARRTRDDGPAAQAGGEDD
ncbi:ScbR family autoregulator-binding transcription factor [Streptomyces lusitanus]|uniref:ScbR family autoregulator-binding transcription factor n=1 Tax=Streptomyces lusitanus TaxID=68232 RepID=A0ABU3JZU3_9ACTN|nr:ScbR family autoregulator-binding transcription factor [Streptomyces lusitanus]